MSLGKEIITAPAVQSSTSETMAVRSKPRMSAFERKQMKKRSTSTNSSPQLPLPSFAIASPITEPSPAVTTPIVPIEDRIELDKSEQSSLVHLEPILSRQLSDASNHVAKRAVAALKEEAIRVQRVLLYVAHAHRNGVISVREKAELKDLLLSKGSKAVVSKLAKYPGGAGVLKTAFDVSSSSSKFAVPASRYHVFRGLGCYSITMFVNEARKLEMALLNGNEHCAVDSNFVALKPSQVANELHEGTKQVLQEPNAGGKSFNSEALSFETLQALFGASNLITEMNVHYKSRHTSIVDFVCDILGHRVGVSVTRAMHFLGEEMFTQINANTLIGKKLGGLDRAAAAVCDEHRFDRQILHVWAQSERVGNLVRAAFEALERPVNANPTICLITVTDRLEKFVFQNDPEMETKERDPFGFETLKKELKRQEHSLVTRLLQNEADRRMRTQQAVRRIFSSSDGIEET